MTSFRHRVWLGQPAATIPESRLPGTGRHGIGGQGILAPARETRDTLRWLRRRRTAHA